MFEQPWSYVAHVTCDQNLQSSISCIKRSEIIVDIHRDGIALHPNQKPLFRGFQQHLQDEFPVLFRKGFPGVRAGSELPGCARHGLEFTGWQV